MPSTVLSRVTADDVVTDPFPNIVVPNALPPELLSRLMAEMPTFETVRTGRENLRGRLPGNTRIHYVGQELLADPKVTTVWKEFVSTHTSPEFFAQLLRIFADRIRRLHPELEGRFGQLPRIKTGIRHVDDYTHSDLLLDALLVFNSPVVSQPTSVRRAHLDSPRKLFTGLLYLRDPDDRSAGGDLELYTFKGGRVRGFDGPEIDDTYVRHAKTIAYGHNVLVLFLNSINSVHGVTVRHPTPFRRCFVSLVGELRAPLFELSPYQQPWPLRALRRLRRRGAAWLRRRLPPARAARA